MNLAHTNYVNHSLIQPLISFHKKVSASFSKLPPHSKALEIAKRIGIIVIAPLAYLVLGFTAMFGLTLELFFKSISKKNDPISMASECDKIKNTFIANLGNSKNVNLFSSGKLYIDIDCEKKQFSKDFVIKPINSSEFNHKYLVETINTIFNEAKDFFGVEVGSEINFNCNVVLKYKDKPLFWHSYHKLKCNGPKANQWFSGATGNAFTNALEVKKYLKDYLVIWGREPKPQLDKQLNFV